MLTLFTNHMWLKYPVIILIFLIAALLQASFLPYFSIITVTPNILFILFFIIIFLKKEREYYYELFVVISAGFFMDIFSNSYLGVSIISLFILYLLIQLTQYLFKERQNEYFIGYFIISFLGYFLAYNLLARFLSSPFNLNTNVGTATLVHIFYNLILAIVGFYMYKKIAAFIIKDRQLKLL